MRFLPLKKTVAWVLLAVSASGTGAQDLNGLLRNLTSRVTGIKDITSALQSLTEVTQGKALPGAQPPADAQGRVILYRTAWCGYCKRAASHMQQRGIAFLERDIESDPAIRAEYNRYGGTGGVPLMVFGQNTMAGFAAAEFDRVYADFQRSGAAAAPTAGVTPHDPIGAVATPAAAARPAPGAEARASLQAGDSLVGKINAVPVYPESSRSSRVLTRLAKADEVVYMGDESNGFYRVTTSSGEGWVDKLLVRKP